MTARWLADNIEHWPLERLVPYINNPRTHSPTQVGQIAASMREFGFTNPILVDREGGIVAGHGRLLAARQLGLTEVPIVRLEHLTPAQARAYVIADNQLALNAAWDEELLALELHGLKTDGFDIGLLGLPDAEVERLLAELEGEGHGDTDKDAVPEAPIIPVTRLGDIWQMGPHRLVCGDATDPGAIARILEGGLADLVFTDPPYNVDYQGSASDREVGRVRTILNDDQGEGFGTFLRRVCSNLLEVTKGALYVCMSSSELHTLQRAFIDAGGHWSTFIVWAKNSFTLGRADYQRQYEPILYGWREGADHYWCGARDQGDVWFIDRLRANDLHPTMKPVALVERAIRNSSKSRDTVLDPFGGSGTTLIACEATGRQGRLIELDPVYCDVIVRRWQEYTGKAAMNLASGLAYAELKENRRDAAA